MNVQAALTAIERVTETDAPSAVLRDLRDENGLAHFVYHTVYVLGFEPNPLLLLTYEEAWVSRCVAQDDFRIDPVAIAGRESGAAATAHSGSSASSVSVPA